MFIIIPLSLSHFLFALLFPLSLTKSFLLSIYTLSCITHRPVFSIVFWVCPSKPRIDLKRKRAKWYNILSTFFWLHHTFHYCFSLWQNIESSLVTKNLFVIYEGGVSLVHLLSAHLVSMIRHSFIIILLYSKHFFFRLVGCLLAILRCSRYKYPISYFVLTLNVSHHSILGISTCLETLGNSNKICSFGFVSDSVHRLLLHIYIQNSERKRAQKLLNQLITQIECLVFISNRQSTNDTFMCLFISKILTIRVSSWFFFCIVSHSIRTFMLQQHNWQVGGSSILSLTDWLTCLVCLGC